MRSRRVDDTSCDENLDGHITSDSSNENNRKIVRLGTVDDLSLHIDPTICSDQAVATRVSQSSSSYSMGNDLPNKTSKSFDSQYSGSIFNVSSTEAIKTGKKRENKVEHSAKGDGRIPQGKRNEDSYVHAKGSGNMKAMKGKRTCTGLDSDQKRRKIFERKMIHPNRIRVQTCNIDTVNGNKPREISTNIPSPKVRVDQVVPLDSPSKLKTNCDEAKGGGRSWSNFRKNNIAFFPFGKIRTLIPVLLSIAAFTLSVCCEKSTRYVDLEIPLEFDGRYNPITRIGLFYMEICRADKFVSSDFVSGTVTITKMEFADIYYVDEDPISEEIKSYSATDFTPVAASAQNVSDSEERVCEIVKLSSTVIEDSLWNAARLFVGLTTWLGFLMSTMLMLSCFWKTMNLTPIGVGLFFTYIFQSFSFFFFDTDLCKEHGCRQKIGGHFAVAAVVCWFSAGLGVLSIILNQRSKRQRADLIEKRQRIAGMLYEKKRINRVRSFMQTQLSFLYLFSSSGRNGEERNTSDTESCSSCEEYVEGRAEM